MKARASITLIVVVAALLMLPLSATGTGALTQESEVRAVVQRVFDQLKAGQYSSLYEVLPSSSRARISRERFTSTLQRTRR